MVYCVAFHILTRYPLRRRRYTGEELTKMVQKNKDRMRIRTHTRKNLKVFLTDILLRMFAKDPNDLGGQAVVDKPLVAKFTVDFESNGSGNLLQYGAFAFQYFLFSDHIPRVFEVVSLHMYFLPYRCRKYWKCC